MKTQAKKIKEQVKTIERQRRKIDALESTVRELLAGTHDMELDGKSQSDMERTLRTWNADPKLPEKILEHDSTDTLKLFWDEQVRIA